MTSNPRAGLGVLAAAVALPVVLACGGGTADEPVQAPSQVEQGVTDVPPTAEPAAEVPVESPIEDPPAEEVYYANCDVVRAAGKAPLRAKDPGYRSKLDRDGDGAACE